MSAVGSLAAGATQQVQQAQQATQNIQVAKRALDQQKLDGLAAISLIQTSGQVAQKAPPPAGDGTGRAVNVLA